MPQLPGRPRATPVLSLRFLSDPMGTIASYGSAFALYEMKLVLATALARLRSATLSQWAGSR